MKRPRAPLNSKRDKNQKGKGYSPGLPSLVRGGCRGFATVKLAAAPRFVLREEKKKLGKESLRL